MITIKNYRNRSLKRILLALTTMTTMSASELKASSPAPKAPPVKTKHIDPNDSARETFVSNYKALNFDLEGDFPAIYWDHGNVTAPGGVKLDTKNAKPVHVYKITSLNGDPIPVKSYKSGVKKNMLQMAEGTLPPEYKNKFKIEEVDLNLSTLNKSNLPDVSDNSYTNAVYFVPPEKREQYHDRAIREHLKEAEDLFKPNVNRFYQLPFARQVVIVDMVYVLRDKIKNSRFLKAILAKNWNGPNVSKPKLTNKQVAMREAWASNKERGTVDKKGDPVGIPPRRFAARRYLLDKGSASLMPKDVPSVETISKSLPPGERDLAEHLRSVLVVTALNNQQQFIRTAALNTKQGLKK